MLAMLLFFLCLIIFLIELVDCTKLIGNGNCEDRYLC